MDQYLNDLKKVVKEELSKERYNLLSNEEKQKLGTEIAKNTLEIISSSILDSLDLESLIEYENLINQNTNTMVLQSFIKRKIPNFDEIVKSKITSYLDTIKI